MRVTARRATREQVFDGAGIELTERPPRTAPGQGAAPQDPLGMSIADLTPEVARQLRLPRGTQGIVVTDVLRGGLADEAGLRVGDLILEVNRQPVRAARDVARIFGEARGKDLVLLSPYPRPRRATQGAWDCCRRPCRSPSAYPRPDGHARSRAWSRPRRACSRSGPHG